ncbi:hypothetical protein N2152v2_002611 [Parachlorella kessleri]
MLRQGLLAVSRRTRQGLQEAVDRDGGQGALLRLQRVLGSSAARAAQEEGAAGAHPSAQPAAATATAARAEQQPPITSAAAAAAGQQQGLSAAPTITKLLGFGGAIPFLALSPFAATHLPLWLLDPALVTHCGVLQIGYGATILSFLGGVHWGVAMTNIGGAVGARLAQERYLWSAVLLGIVYAVDRSWARRGLLPPWYMSLRGPLTLLAATGLAMTAALDAPPGVLTKLGGK